MTEDLTFSINIDSPIAVYVQIRNQVQFYIASGRLKPGGRLPSVREMSDTLGINPNTVTKSYRDLELMQIVQTRRGVGVTITDKAPHLCRAVVRDMVTAHLVEAVAECLSSGLSQKDIANIVDRAIGSGCVPYKV